LPRWAGRETLDRQSTLGLSFEAIEAIEASPVERSRLGRSAAGRDSLAFFRPQVARHARADDLSDGLAEAFRIQR
jgi:hypothetical protein